MQMAMIVGMLPSLLLSGFIFPIQSMPAFFHYFTAVMPVRWYVEISRGLFLRGAGLVELAVPFLVLTAMTAMLMAAAIGRFKKDMEP